MTGIADLTEVPEDIRSDVARGVDILKRGGCSEVSVHHRSHRKGYATA